MMYLCIIFAAFLGGIVQATTGFGAGIMMMLFFPYLLPILQASALSSLIGIVVIVMMAWTYRKHINFKLIPAPVIVYMICSAIAITIATKINMESLKIVFGFFLLILALYFIFKSESVKLKPNFPTAAVCSALSGTASGLFGIGGPPMALYFLAVTGDDKLTYLGTLQCFFLITQIYNFTLRCINGYYTTQIFLLAIPGMVGLLAGKYCGSKIVDKMPVATLKKVIYAFLAFSGIVTIVTNLF